MNKKSNYANILSVNNADLTGAHINPGGFVAPYWNGVSVPFLAVFMDLGETNYTLDEDVQLNTKYISNLNWLNNHKITLNNKLMGSIPADVTSYDCANPILFGSSRAGTLLNSSRLNGKIYRARISKNAGITHDLIPALNAEGVPGMFDKVSKQFFVNNGTGSFGYRIKGAPTTFALRDPHRVAPSGVYARLIAENELEIVADTEETTGEGWEWFSSTADAYAHFGITEQEFV